MKTAAIIPAAGAGRRMEKPLAKQYLPLGGRPIIARTLESLAKAPIIDDIFIVLDPGRINYFHEKIMKLRGLKKIRGIIEGGPTRQESVYNGLKKIRGNYDLAVIHDAVRPFIDLETLLEVIAQAHIHKAAAAAVPATDTIKETDGEGFITSTVPRGGLWAVQTPQAFSLELIIEAHEKAREDFFAGTDDASLVERIGKKIKIVEGSRWNIKITTAEDFVIAEGILRELGL